MPETIIALTLMAFGFFSWKCTQAMKRETDHLQSMLDGRNWKDEALAYDYHNKRRSYNILFITSMMIWIFAVVALVIGVFF